MTTKKTTRITNAQAIVKLRQMVDMMVGDIERLKLTVKQNFLDNLVLQKKDRHPHEELEKVKRRCKVLAQSIGHLTAAEQKTSSDIATLSDQIEGAAEQADLPVGTVQIFLGGKK